MPTATDPTAPTAPSAFTVDPVDEAAHRFVPRRPRFTWDGTPTSWVPGDAHTSHVIDVLHLMLPAGERWFVDVYREVLPLLDDDDLRRDVRAFIGQEATHARAHTHVLDHLAEVGIDPSGFTGRLDAGFRLARTRRAPRWLPAPVRRAVDRRYLLWQLAVVAAVEHFTAVLGWWIVTTRALDRAGADPQVLALLRWHGAEEVEHRSVAFDTYRALGGGWLRRALVMAVTAPVLAALWHRGTTYLLRRDPDRSGGRRASLRRYRRAERAGLVPPLGALVGSVPRYLAPRYHPSHECRAAVAIDHLAALDRAA